jgi:YVTN family beta-propeller protein
VFLTQRLMLALAGVLLVAASAAEAANPIFVLNSLDANVSVIDPVTWQETRRIATGKEPHHIYLMQEVIRSPSSTHGPPKCNAWCAAHWTPTNCGFRRT